AEDYGWRSHADRYRGFDERLLLHRQRRGARHARKSREERDRPHRHDVPEAAAEYGGNKNRQQKFGKREQEVNQPADEPVEDAAEPARGEAEDRAEEGGEGRRQDPEDQRIARAPDHAREHVAAEEVGAQPVLLR